MSAQKSAATSTMAYAALNHSTSGSVAVQQNRLTCKLLDFCFFKQNVLARLWVVLAHFKLLGRCASVLLFHVEVAGVGGADHFDQNASWFSHGIRSCVEAWLVSAALWRALERVDASCSYSIEARVYKGEARRSSRPSLSGLQNRIAIGTKDESHQGVGAHFWTLFGHSVLCGSHCGRFIAWCCVFDALLFAWLLCAPAHWSCWVCGVYCCAAARCVCLQLAGRVIRRLRPNWLPGR